MVMDPHLLSVFCQISIFASSILTLLIIWLYSLEGLDQITAVPYQKYQMTT